MTLTTEQIRQFGVPFSDAFTHFASQELIDDLSEAQADIEPPKPEAERPILSAVIAVSHLFQMPTLQKVQAEKEQRIMAEMQAHLQYWMETGEFVAFGNQTAPTPVRTRRKIHHEYWRHALIDWQSETSTATDSAVSYSRLVVIDAQAFPENTFFPPMGPKYYGAQILEAMENLNRKIGNFRTAELSHKARSKMIRDWVLDKYPHININDRGFHAATIRRHFVRFRNQPNFKF